MEVEQLSVFPLSCSYLFRTCCEPRTRVWFPSLGKRLVREMKHFLAVLVCFIDLSCFLLARSSFTRLFYSRSSFARAICCFVRQILDKLVASRNATSGLALKGLFDEYFRVLLIRVISVMM